MKLCHGPSNLIPRGKSNTQSRDEYLFTCRVCGQKWQWTKAVGYYQVKTRAAIETKTVSIRARITKTRHKEILTAGYTSGNDFINNAPIIKKGGDSM